MTPHPAVPQTTNPATFAEDMDAYLAWMAINADELAELGSNYALGLTAASSTNLVLSTGTKTLTVSTGKGYAVGMDIVIASYATPTNRMLGTVTAYDAITGVMVAVIYSATGSGTLASWVISMTAAVDASQFATPAGVQTLTNKTLNLANNTVTGTLAQFNAALTDADLASVAGVQTLTNKTLTSPTLTSPVMSSITNTGTITLPTVTGTLSTLAGTETLTNKTLDGEVYSTTATVTAGTNAQGQGALTSDYSVISTAAASPSGVTLPVATVGRRVVIVNRGANPVNIYPATGASIDGGAANAAVSLPVGRKIQFDSSSTTVWYSSLTDASTTLAPLASPTLTGVPVAPTAAAGTDTTQLATTEFVNAAAAGKYKFTATGSVAAGQVVAMNADGTISAIASSTAPGTPGAEIVVTAANVTIDLVVDVPGTNKVLIFYGQSNVVCATVDVQSSTVSFGVPLTGCAWGTRTYESQPISVCWYPTDSVFTVAYYNTTTQISMLLLTVTGTFLAVGAPYNAPVAATSAGLGLASAYCTIQNRVVVAYPVTTLAINGFVVTISSGVVTWQTGAQALGGGSIIRLCALAEVPGTSRLALWLQTAAVGVPNVTVITVNGNVVSGTGNSVAIGAVTSTSPLHGSLHYLSGQDRFVGFLSVGALFQYLVFSVSGTTVTSLAGLVAAPSLYSGTVSSSRASFDSNLAKFVLHATDNLTNRYSNIVTASLVGNALVLDTVVVGNTATSTFMVSGYNSFTQRVVFGFQDAADTFPHVRVWQAGVTSTTADKWVGVAEAAISNAALGIVTTVGGVNSQQAGLTPSSDYYIDDTGTLTLTNNGRFAGTALTANKLALLPPRIKTLTDLVPSATGQSGRELIADGNTPVWVDPAGNRAKFTALGAIAAGDVVVLNGTGTVSKVSNVVGASVLGAKQAITAVASSTNYKSISIPGTDKVVLMYGAGGVTSVVVGQVSAAGNTVTLGTPVALAGTAGTHSITWNTVEDKFVVGYASTTAFVVVGTVSGTTITLGTPSNSGFVISAAYKVTATYSDQQNKTLVAAVANANNLTNLYSVTITAGVVTWGTANASLTGITAFTSAQLPGTPYFLVASGSNIFTVVGINATVVSVYNTVTVSGLGNSNNQDIVYSPASSAFVITGNNGYSVVRVSGITPTAGALTALTGFALSPAAPNYDAGKGTLLLVGLELSTNYAIAVPATISGNALSLGTTNYINSTSSANHFGAYNAAQDRVVLSFIDGGTSNTPASRVLNTGSSSTNANSWVGVSAETIASGGFGTVALKGGINSAMSGLTTGLTYYIDDAGALQQTGSRIAGVALSATKLLINGNA